MRKNILEIKRKLEHKLNENMTINDIECNNCMMMTNA